jgi:DNA invertase Pin-like site-specific DNA recombinase
VWYRARLRCPMKRRATLAPPRGRNGLRAGQSSWRYPRLRVKLGGGSVGRRQALAGGNETGVRVRGSRGGREREEALMARLLIGYARVSTAEEDLTAQREAVAALGVSGERIYVGHGLTGANRDRPGLREALAACREGDTLVVAKLDRLARSLPPTRATSSTSSPIAQPRRLPARPSDPVGRFLFNVLAMVAQFEADLIRMRTREGMARRPGQGAAARQAAEAQSAPGGAPGRAAPSGRVQRRRARRPGSASPARPSTAPSNAISGATRPRAPRRPRLRWRFDSGIRLRDASSTSAPIDKGQLDVSAPTSACRAARAYRTAALQRKRNRLGSA